MAECALLKTEEREGGIEEVQRDDPPTVDADRSLSETEEGGGIGGEQRTGRSGILAGLES